MYDFFIVAAHPDNAKVQMGGTIAKLTRAGQRALIVDLCDGEPRRQQAMRAAQILGADRLLLDQQDRFITDNIPTRLTMARLIRQHRPRMIFATTKTLPALIQSRRRATIFTCSS